MTQLDLKNIKITPVDSEAANEGSWTKYRGVDVKLARANNERFKKTFLRLSRPHRKDIANDSIDAKVAKDIMVEALADGVLVGWKNFMIGETEIEYTRSNAITLLKNDEDFLIFIQEYSKDLNNYIIRDKEETVVKS